MLSLPLVALCLATIGGYAKSAVRAASGLEVSLSTPTDKVASVSDLRVVATVKNASDKDLKILKFGTVLDAQHHARPFVVSKDGKEVPFTGTEVCTPPPRPFGLSVNTHADSSHRFSLTWITPPRITGLSSTPARMRLPSTMVSIQTRSYGRDVG